MSHRLHFILFCFWLYLLPYSATASSKIMVGVVGMGANAAAALQGCGKDMQCKVVDLATEDFRPESPIDLSGFDLLIAAFKNEELKDGYRAAFQSAKQSNPRLQIFYVGPPQLCAQWREWLGADLLNPDPEPARYYGLSERDMENMLRYILITYFGRTGKIVPPDLENAIKIFHPQFGASENIAQFLESAQAAHLDVENTPRVALGVFRHHCIFHQPKVVKALIENFARENILAVAIIADDAGFKDRLREFRPDLVIMTSHTMDSASFWEEMDVPRIHAVWMIDESIEEWANSTVSGMSKGSVQHLYLMAEVRGSTECLTSGGTSSGQRSGEEILPIPDRIERIVKRSKSWIRLRHLDNREKRIGIIGYDHNADAAMLLCGQQHGLNAPRSLLVLLEQMRQAGYSLKNLPVDEKELLARLVDHGRQQGSWEAGVLNRLARSGKAVLLPVEKYQEWFKNKVPPRAQQEMIKYWGEAPGNLMVWRKGNQSYMVLPKLDFGNAVLLTQPPKGEALSASVTNLPPEDDLLPPTHAFLATYFWLQEEFKADALIHFGAHGNECFFPGKQVTLSSNDWSDILMGNMPNINPWVANNTPELLPCKRRSYAVTIDHLPPLLMEAGLSDELLNLESLIDKYITLDEGALKNKFAASVTEAAQSANVAKELNLPVRSDGLLADDEIKKISAWLHDLQNEAIPANMHILGQKPDDPLLIPYYVHCLGEDFLEGVRPWFNLKDDELREACAKNLQRLLRDKVPLEKAFAGTETLPATNDWPAAVLEGIETVRQMDAALDLTGQEVTNILRALSGRFIAPGPSGAPERNPGVVPTGRNVFVLNPEELPARASWELGSQLMADYLRDFLKSKGHYPQKIGFGLIPYATYSDFGIIESQILYLLGVRPLWDRKNRVSGIELIPREELGRPRIDVFLSAKIVYQDELPELMNLLDRAIRMVAVLDEPENYVFQHSAQMRKQLAAAGIDSDMLAALAQARMFGPRPEETVDGHNSYFYLVERSGEWETREELMNFYLQRCNNVFTEGLWGVPAPEAFEAALQDTESIVRSWYDPRTPVLSDKFAWWGEGSLALAIKHITGREPDYLFADVRRADKANMVSADSAMQQDVRARLLNPKWIKMLMDEGYNGAAQISKTIDNLMGWKIMREQSVDDFQWEKLTDMYVRDQAGLGVREWFDNTNPYAFQNLAATMLESARKGLWHTTPATTLELAEAYAYSVVRHGRSGGLREGGNASLHGFVENALGNGTEQSQALLAAYQAVLAADTAASATENVSGQAMDPVQEKTSEQNKMDKIYHWLLALIIFTVLLLGYRFRRNGVLP